MHPPRPLGKVRGGERVGSGYGPAVETAATTAGNLPSQVWGRGWCEVPIVVRRRGRRGLKPPAGTTRRRLKPAREGGHRSPSPRRRTLRGSSREFIRPWTGAPGPMSLVDGIRAWSGTGGHAGPPLRDRCASRWSGMGVGGRDESRPYGVPGRRRAEADGRSGVREGAIPFTLFTRRGRI